MATLNESLDTLMGTDGAVCAALVDANSGMCLGTAGNTATFDLDVAAAGNTEVVRAKMKTMASLGIKESIEDILITLNHQYHVINPVAKHPGLFLYVVLDRAKSNLAMARRRTADVSAAVTI